MLRSLDISNSEHLKAEFNHIGVNPGGMDIMVPKGQFYIFKTDRISHSASVLLKDQMLKLNAECAISREAVKTSEEKHPVIMMGTREHYKKLVDKLNTENYPELSKIVQDLKNFFATRSSGCLKIRGNKYDLDKKTLIMGILNITPDSFSDGGQFNNQDDAVKEALKMENQGADIIDIGGESTRPGAEPVTLDEELNRVLPVIKGIREKSQIPISIDTYKAEVADRALSAGADIVNDISGLRFDKNMAETVAEHKVPVILMHIKGEPRNMQDNPEYENIFDEILEYFDKSINIALEAGISREQIILDPGFGFGKKWEDNYRLLKHLKEFKSPGYPLLIGTSRKSFIGNILDLPVDQRLEGTLATITAGIMNGADIIRVHDVKEAVRVIKVTDKIIGKR